MSDEYDFLFKSIVVGDGGVGKTALTLRFSKDFFSEDYKMTIGVDFHVKTLTVDTNEGPIRAKLQIWDTGGQERFSSIRPMYYRGSLGALMIFDLTNYESFEHLPQWIEEVRANVKNDIPLLLVGNKSDLIDQRVISMDELNTFTKQFDLYYMETSAKTGAGVGDCFHILACLMIGSGVPEQFLNSGVVSYPGQISITGISSAKDTIYPIKSELESSAMPVPETTLELEPEFEFEAPPVPEKSTVVDSKPSFEIEPELEFEFEAPPVLEKGTIVESKPSFKIEPELEFEFETPPIPENSVISKTEHEIPIFKKENEEKVKQIEEFEFKTPDEILSKVEKKKELPAASLSSESFKSTSTEKRSESPVYKPKVVPFSSNIPVPAPAPEGFPRVDDIKSSVPFPVSNDSEISKPTQELTDHFFPIPDIESSQTTTSLQSEGTASDSLFDYMPQTIISKKEQKKIEKQKKKEAKEQAKLDKERKTKEAKEQVKKEKKSKPKEAKEQAKLDKEKKIKEAKEAKEKAKLEEIRKAKEAKEQAKLDKERKIKEAKEAKEKVKKEKKSKPKEVKVPQPPSKAKATGSPTLFQSLSQKTIESSISENSTFIPFTATEGTKSEETSNLKIIPNVEDIKNNFQDTLTSFQTTPIPKKPKKKSGKKQKKKEIRICGQCGSVLSSDYAFCNKCGNKL